MAYGTQNDFGGIGNCGAIAEAYYLSERAKTVAGFKVVNDHPLNEPFKRAPDQLTDIQYVNDIFTKIRLNDIGRDELINRYKAELHIRNDDLLQDSLMYQKPPFNIDYIMLWQMSSPIKMVHDIIDRININLNEVTIYMPGENTRVIGIFRETIRAHDYVTHEHYNANNILNRIDAAHEFTEDLLNDNNVCIELVFVKEKRMGTLHYILSYKDRNNKVRYINPWLGYAKDRHNPIDGLIDANYTLIPTGAGILLPRA